jgi:hypothetical protein
MDSTEIAKLGASLRRIDQKLLTSESEQGGLRVWYQGGEPYFDLFVELQEGEVVWFQLTLRGRAISWSKKRDRGALTEASCWQTGQTNELQTDDLTFYAASKLIERDRQVNRSFLDLVYAILKTRSGEPIFDQILALFEPKSV